MLFGGAVRGGKLLSLDTPIFTPNGWRSVDDIHIGDKVFGLNGYTCQIVWESPIQFVPGYKLTFDSGTSIISNDDHLWLTFDLKERAALTRRTEEFRRRRRSKRPSRVTGNKSIRFTESLIQRNRENPPKIKLPPKGTIRTTSQIVSTLKVRNKHNNHAIPLAHALQLHEKRLPLDPYLLGCWLGAGTTSSGQITTADEEVIKAFQDKYEIGAVRQQKNNKAATYRIVGLTTLLRKMGLLGNKHISAEYIQSSESQRMSLLQGLLDTDGNCDLDGGVEFCSTRRILAENTRELIISLGFKATLRESDAKLRGRIISKCYRVKFAPNQQVFRIKRKAERLKKTNNLRNRFHYIISAERVPPTAMKCFRVDAKDGLFLIGKSLIATHNTTALMVASVMYHDLPSHNSIIFRKNRDDLYLPDGPIDIAERWDWTGKGAHWDGARHRYTFPSGKTVTFGYVGEQGSESYKRYKSSWFQDIFFDQVEEISFKQYDWMRNRLGRLLEHQDVPLRFWSSANPDGYQWVYEHFVKPETRARDTRFIPATADDNPWVDLQALEDTLSRIKDPITYRQLRQGVWGLVSSGGMFNPVNFTLLDQVPFGEPLIGVRYWDLAATGDREGGSPAYSAGVRMLRNLKTEQIYVDSVLRGRWSPLEVENQLRDTAMLDLSYRRGHSLPRLTTVIEREPGASGKSIMDHYLRVVLAGLDAQEDKVSDPKSVRAGPWAAAVARRVVHLVLGETSAEWIDAYRNEHRGFPQGETKDMVDSSSGAYNHLYNLSRKPKVR